MAAPPARSLRPVEPPAADVGEPLHCRECGSAGSVYHHFCEVCYADADPGAERGSPRPLAGPILHPSIPVRFSDVMAELRSIADLATGQGDTPRWRVAAACRRAEALLMVLRRQFVNEVVLGDLAPRDASRA